MPPVVVYDACVLYPAPLRDLLLRLADAELVRARWSEIILEEVFRNLARARPDLLPNRLERTRELMRRALPDCMVKGFEPLIEDLTLPDVDDRHVLAAAVHSGATSIVTSNLRDFPDEAMEPFGILAVHPDDFVLDLIDESPGVVHRVLGEQIAALRNPPVALAELLGALERSGLPRSVAKISSQLNLS